MVHLVGKVSVEVVGAAGIPPNVDAYVKVYAVRERKLLPEKHSLFTKTKSVKNQDVVEWNHKKLRTVNGDYKRIYIQLKDKGLVKDNVLGELDIPMDELVSKHQYRLVCAHVGPAGHDRCITVGVSYFPGDVDKDFSSTSTDPETAGRF